MKLNNPILLFGAAVLFMTGCMNNYPAHMVFSEFNDKIVFPTFPHTDTVNVYMQGDTLPEKPFIEVGVFEFQVNRRTSMDELKKILVGLAMDEGLDAVYLADIFEEEIIPFEFTQPGKWVSAIGLVYPEYVDYLEYFAKEQNFYLLSEDNKKDTLLQKVLIDFEGDIQLVADSMRRVNAAYMEYVYNYSLKHLIEEITPRWRYKNEKGLLKKRSFYAAGGKELKRVYFEYEKEGNTPDNKIVKINITNFNQENKGQLLEEIVFSFRDDGSIKERIIKRNDREFLKEDYRYDDLGRLDRVVIFQNGNDGYKPVLLLEYVYYKNIEAYRFVPEEIKQKYKNQMPVLPN